MASIPIIIDRGHHNLMDPKGFEYTDFFNFLESQGFHVKHAPRNMPTTPDILEGAKFFLIGVPQTSFFTRAEIHAILDFVRNGGSLLVFQRYV